LVKKRGWNPAFSPNIQKYFAACGSRKALLRSSVLYISLRYFYRCVVFYQHRITYWDEDGKG